MTFRLVHAAGNMFMPAAKRAGIYATAATLGDVLTFSEAQKDHARIKALSGFDSVCVGELAIAWKADQFQRVDQGAQTVMVGGKRGAGGKGDRRRRGPSRLVLWVVLRDLETGDLFLIWTHHSIAKADTSFLWRRPLRAEGFRNTANTINAARRKYPTALVIGTGDWNTKGRVDYGIGLREVPTPATFGRLRYDRVQVGVGVHWSGLWVRRGPGDHLMVVVDLYATGETPPPPAPPSAAPVSPPKAGKRRRRPLNPWSRKGRRIRRRNRPRWRRIRARWRRWRKNRRRK